MRCNAIKILNLSALAVHLKPFFAVND